MGARLRWIGVLVGLVAIAAAQPAVGQVSGGQRAQATLIPKKMVGSWSRFVSVSAFQHFGVTDPAPGVWVLQIKRTGLIDIFKPKIPTTGTPTLEGTIRITGTHAVLKVGCSTSNRYGWKVSSTGKLLTFTYSSDANCKQRAAVISGYWKKRS